MKKLLTLIAVVMMIMTTKTFAADKATTTKKTSKISTVSSVGTTGFVPQKKGAKINLTPEQMVAYAKGEEKPNIEPSNTCWNGMWQEFAEYLRMQIIVFMSAELGEDLTDDEEYAYEEFLKLPVVPAPEKVTTIGLLLNKDSCIIEGLADAITRNRYVTVDDLKIEYMVQGKSGAISTVCANAFPGIKYTPPKINTAEFDEDDRVTDDTKTYTTKGAGITNIINVYGATATVKESGNSTMTAPTSAPTTSTGTTFQRERVRTYKKPAPVYEDDVVYEDEDYEDEYVESSRKVKKVYVQEDKGCNECGLAKANLAMTTIFGLANTAMNGYQTYKLSQMNNNGVRSTRPPRGNQNQNQNNNNNNGMPSCAGAYKHYYANGEWQWKCPDYGTVGNTGSGNTGGNDDDTGNSGDPGGLRKKYSTNISAYKNNSGNGNSSYKKVNSTSGNSYTKKTGNNSYTQKYKTNIK
jgi:hypothetical protein